MSRRNHSSYQRYKRKEFIRSKRHWIIALAVLLALLIAGGTWFYIHWKRTYDTVYYSEIEECSLPVLTMKYNGQNINRTFGYTSEMDFKYIRDNVFVLEEGYDIDIEFDLYGNTAESLQFSLYDIDNNKLIQRGNVINFRYADDDKLEAVLHIDNMIDFDKEYTIDIKLVDGRKREIHYYSRVMYNSTSPLKGMMDLVWQHHNAMYNKLEADFLIDFQEPNSAVNDSTNFGDISLSSTLNSMTWGTMEVRVITDPVLSIVDLDTDLGFFRLTYQVGRTSDEGVEEYYNVSEYYRTRMYADVRFILSYERTVNQILTPNAGDVGNKSVLIGIYNDLDFQTLTNSKENMNVFVADKSVWFMDTDTKTLQKVFSFENEPQDIRQNYDQHEIKLLKIDDNGDFQFLVYGYMNRGLHEGQTGIGLYTYSVERNEVRENIFIPSSLPYQVLKNSIGALCYLNKNGKLFIMFDEYIYRMDPEANSAKLLISGLNDNNFKVSFSGRMLAWQDEGLVNNATKINVMDLETESVYHISAHEGRNIKVLGFLDDDLVYGEGDKGYTYTTAEGEEYLLMPDLYVIDSKNVIQTSEHSTMGYFISSVTEYNRVVVNRLVRVGSEYKKGDEFTLFSTGRDNTRSTTTYNIYDENRRTINYIEVVKTMDSKRPVEIDETTSISLCSAENTDVEDMLSDEGKYYVYAQGEIVDILTSPAEAIMRAYYSTGVVVTDNGYFYRRSSRPTTVELTNSSIRSAGDAYNDGTLLNITGIYLNQALYFTGRRIPVVWEWGDSVYVIYGYDLFDNLMLYDINTGEELLLAYDDIDQIFDEVGRCFILTT